MSWLILVLACGGTLALWHGLTAQRQALAVHDQGDIPALAGATVRNGTDPATPATGYLPYAEPTAIHLPTIGVASDLISVGKQPDGSMEVPEQPHFDKAAWYRHSPTPGQYGAAVIIGHVDSYANGNSASVFYGLARLGLGDPVDVRRVDGSRVRFTVRAIRDYDKHGLPTEIIYGPVGELPELRLITCGGRFDHATGSYERNTVVYATAAPRQPGGTSDILENDNSDPQ